MTIPSLLPPASGLLAGIPGGATTLVWTGIFVVAEILGVLSAFNVVMRGRTPQGAVAWVIALVALPIVSVPLYWVFGRNRFQGYVETIRTAIRENQDLVDQARRALQPHHGVFARSTQPAEYALDQLTPRSFTTGNRVELLIDGEATFDAIFKAIDEAESYLLIQFYIIRSDDLGTRLKDRLLRKVKAGVRVYLLFDEIGCARLADEYIADLRAGGIDVSAFGTRRGPHNRFQLNFRNHRKIVVADGRVAFVGGHNVGDEYLGKVAKFGAWRDTHVLVKGPAVQGIQSVFIEDWFWATRRAPKLEWTPRPCQDHDAMVLPLETGPLHEIESCTLFIHQLIADARDRLWIASPYFVPDEGITHALQLAALRGVDVRIMLPSNPDHRLVWLAAYSYLEQMHAAGVKMFRYRSGFLHQKTALVDDRLAVVGTANLDNRSLLLNFEISIVVSDHDFARKVKEMFERDFENCYQIETSEYTSRSLPMRLAIRSARLLAPIL